MAQMPLALEVEDVTVSFSGNRALNSSIFQSALVQLWVWSARTVRAGQPCSMSCRGSSGQIAAVSGLQANWLTFAHRARLATPGYSGCIKSRRSSVN